MKARELIVILILSFVTCCGNDETIKQGTAYEEIYAAILYKNSECGTMPSYPLILPKHPPEYGTDICSFAIIAQTCPFKEYPAECLGIYDSKFPGYGPMESRIKL